MGQGLERAECCCYFNHTTIIEQSNSSRKAGHDPMGSNHRKAVLEIMECGDEVKSIYAEIGFNLDVFRGNPNWIVPGPATYVIGAGGRIKAGSVSADFRRRMSPDDILSTLSQPAFLTMATVCVASGRSDPLGKG